VEHHAEVLTGGVWRQRIPSRRDIAAILLMLGLVILLGIGARQMVAPFVPAHTHEISLSATALPLYTLRTVMRMLAALLASLMFTFTYATLAAKNRRAEMVLIPILDVLQSVPILGYLSFTVVFFVSLFPGNVLGPELAAIFAIFTSQAWNMAFSFYQSLRTVPTDLDEVAAFAHQPASASGAWKSRSRCRASSGICSPSLAAPRSRIFARATSTGPMPVWIVRAGP
jgi:NitT/TauT family transport system permease protein